MLVLCHFLGKTIFQKIYGDSFGSMMLMLNPHILLSLLLLFSIFTQVIHRELLAAEEEMESHCLVLTLTRAISRALNYNRQLLNTLENVTQSQYDVELAHAEFDIQILPNGRAGYVGGGEADTGLSIGGGMDFSKKFPIGTQITLGPSILKTCEHYHTEWRALVMQPLLRGLGRDYQLSGLLSAQFALRTAYRYLYIAQVQLIIRTIQTLYEAIKAEKSLALSQESHQRIHQFYQAAKLKEKIGLADPLDTYRAEIELRLATEALTGAQERLQEAEDLIRDLLALPLDQGIKVDVPLAYTPNFLTLEKAVELALENRIEMDQAEDQWRDSGRLSRLAKKNVYPELNLVFNYSNCGRDQIFTRSCNSHHRESTWGVGLTTSANFDPMAEQFAYEQSLLAVTSSKRAIEQTEATLILDVKRAMRQLQRAYQRIHLQEEQIQTAQGELALAKLKFDHGMADNFHVLQAEKSLSSAQQAYWSSLIEHIIGEFQLLAAMGLLIEKPSIS